MADDALGPAESVQEIVQVHDLLHLVGRARLLAVAEGGVGYKRLLGRVQRLYLMVEINAADLFV